MRYPLLTVVSSLLLCVIATAATAASDAKPADGAPPAKGDTAVPSLPDTLAWLQRVDAQLAKPRLAGLTLEQVKTLTELQLGGHRKSDK